MRQPIAAGLYLDSNIIVHVVEGHPTHISELELLVAALDDGRLTCVTSELTLAEVLVKPFAHPDLKFRNEYEKLLSSNPGLSVIPVTRRVCEYSAEMRARRGGKLADSIHVATAALFGCSHFLSEDARIKLPDHLILLTLSTLSPLLQSTPESS